MSNKNLIPKNISNDTPKKCPVCNKNCYAVFRTWKGKTKRVSVEFVHYDTEKTCKKTYDFK